MHPPRKGRVGNFTYKSSSVVHGEQVASLRLVVAHLGAELDAHLELIGQTVCCCCDACQRHKCCCPGELHLDVVCAGGWWWCGRCVLCAHAVGAGELTWRLVKFLSAVKFPAPEGLDSTFVCMQSLAANHHVCTPTYLRSCQGAGALCTRIAAGVAASYPRTDQAQVPNSSRRCTASRPQARVAARRMDRHQSQARQTGARCPTPSHHRSARRSARRRGRRE